MRAMTLARISFPRNRPQNSKRKQTESKNGHTGNKRNGSPRYQLQIWHAASPLESWVWAPHFRVFQQRPSPRPRAPIPPRGPPQKKKIHAAPSGFLGLAAGAH